MSLSDELLSLSSVEMRRRIGTKEVSPVELVEASIARIEALNPAVNAIAATDFAHARKLAVSAESAARIAAMRHLFSTCDEVKFDFGEADRCFDVVRAQSYVDRYRDAYTKDPNSLGRAIPARSMMGRAWYDTELGSWIQSLSASPS